jgi:glucokinase
VRGSDLSAPTVTNLVSVMEAANLIKLLGEGESSGGRPPDMISFNAARGCLLAVDIKADSLSFLLTDLRGTQLGSASVLVRGPPWASSIVALPRRRRPSS